MAVSLLPREVVAKTTSRNHVVARATVLVSAVRAAIGFLYRHSILDNNTLWTQIYSTKRRFLE